MANVMTELKTYIVAETSLTAAQVFTGVIPAEPHVCLTIREYGGAPPMPGMGVTGIQYEEPGVQFVMRGEPDDYETPRTMIEIVYRKIAEIQTEILSGTQYLIVRPVQSPFPLGGPDKKGRHRLAFNVLCEKEPS